MICKKTYLFLITLSIFTIYSKSSFALVDLVTLPKRDSVQLTIYNSADLTLVKETRTLSLEKGINRLEFSWAGTLIDPTSIFFKSKDEGVYLVNLSFPPRIKGSAIWSIKSDITKPCKVEISYFTSGFRWESFYIGTLNEDESLLNLEGYVKVQNLSGEDYENAQTRLIVGKIHILDEIAELARKIAPYGDPRSIIYEEDEGLGRDKLFAEYKRKEEIARVVMEKAIRGIPKKIIKEGLSEYFLYTIEGTETIKNKWQKRLPSFHQENVPVKNLFKYDPYKYGDKVCRFLYFKNDKSHKLGQTPLPGGIIKVFQSIDKEGHLKYIGEDKSKYIPVGQEVELNLGQTQGVTVKPKLMNKKTIDFTFNQYGDIWGYTEVEDHTIKVKNLRSIHSKVEIREHLRHQYWKIKLKKVTRYHLSLIHI